MTDPPKDDVLKTSKSIDSAGDPYLHCACGHSIYTHDPLGIFCEHPCCSGCGGFDQCDCNVIEWKNK